MTVPAGSPRSSTGYAASGSRLTAWSPSTPAARTTAPTCSPPPSAPSSAAPGSTSFPEAVALGLEHVGDCEWVWILHDDANPDPGALEALLAASIEHPRADILGPKLREWPSLRRLLELGVTISGTGRRETGLERGEYDQGQHDDVREVLAVNTAGMLVRRTVLNQLGGFDRQLPIFGNDIDFGWRAAEAGHRTLIVPQAVVFHAEAAHRGIRRTPITGRHTHYQERRAALYTLLANSSGRSLPFQVVRLAFGTVLRMIGFLLARQVGQALDELAALVSVYSSPRELSAARRTRRDDQVARPRPRSAGCWRRGGCPTGTGSTSSATSLAAATNQAADVAERRRAAKLAESGEAPRRVVQDEDDGFGQDTGLVVRFLTNPVAVSVTLFVILALSGPATPSAPCPAARCPRSRSRERLVAAAHGVLAPDRPGHRRPRAGVRAAAGHRGDPPRRQSRRRHLGVAGAGRAVLPLGRLAVPARGRPARRPAWLRQAAARVGCRDVRADPGRQRCLGRGSFRRGRRGRPAAVARPRRARLRRPGARPPVAGGLAVRAPARARGGVRAAAVLVRRRPRAGRRRVPGSRSAPG